MKFYCIFIRYFCPLWLFEDAYSNVTHVGQKISLNTNFVLSFKAKNEIFLSSFLGCDNSELCTFLKVKVKVKIHPRTDHEGLEWSKVIAVLFL